MVSFTKDSIVIKIDSDRPFEHWLEMLRSLEEITPFLVTNQHWHPFDSDLWWFIELKKALLEPEITFNQQREIEKVLSIELT